ncbi:tetrahydromethanopterin S-methyltransferase subunit MtrG [Methanocaldococcus fervens]|uniref:Tetrahydromethanopterin S-methyltransferase subunit G n=1 Tax=Methanocaldococcus fervens (strain DSM 4213 / JCM 15782 / AG86) TaxID=573064 RepID=C7P881_METFA|nr:tetrahydromethanopterin S-methyltransferase subunit G [Methanocaldococcus fervens]ACV24763.1 tetrahydromethanopterin S-methyltransferase, subunit G [Methanocaldococcus fervens AG86]
MSEIPTVVTPTKDFKRLMEKLEELEEKVENTNAEIFQRAGKKVGRDVGIAYGLIIGTLVAIVLPNLLNVMQLVVKMAQ